MSATFYEKLNASRLLQAGSDEDAVFIGPVGTQMPTAMKTFDPAFKHIGWLGEDGFKATPNDSAEDFKGHQGGRVIKTEITESKTSVSFTALETSLQTLGFQFDIKKSQKGSGFTTHTMSSARTVKNVALVFYWEAGGHQYQLACPTVQITERSEITIGRKEVTAYAITATIIGDVFLMTTDPALQVD